MMDKLDDLRTQIKNDPENKPFTDKGWEPIYMVDARARVLIIGQAPGAKTQEMKGVFHDQSGVRLRSWLGVDEAMFYESGLIAVLPMDFYFPGHGKQGDLPPRPEFYQKWHPQFLEAMPHVELVILVGMYAQNVYLKPKAFKTITENVLHYKMFLPHYFPLIHPSPRNQVWMSRHPEFAEVILPDLKKHVQKILNT